MESTIANEGRLPKRSEIPFEYQWRLEDLFASDDEWEAEYRSVEELLPQIAAFRGQLGTSAENLLAALAPAGSHRRATGAECMLMLA